MWPLMHGATDKLRMGNPPLSFSRCGPGNQMTPEMAAYLGRDTVLAITYCQRWAWWVPDGYSAVVLLEQGRSGAWTRSLTATVPIDQKGRPVRPVTPDLLIGLFLLVAGGAWLLSRASGQTIGKAMLGLKVELPNDAAALRREVFRALPFVALGLVEAGIQASPAVAHGVGAELGRVAQAGPVAAILAGLVLSGFRDLVLRGTVLHRRSPRTLGPLGGQPRRARPSVTGGQMRWAHSSSFNRSRSAFQRSFRSFSSPYSKKSSYSICARRTRPACLIGHQ